MGDWILSETYSTSAGCVAGGQCGDGPDLVLAHGWPWSSFAWRRVIPELSRHFRVYWYDMPGYGQSEKPVDQPTSLDVQGRIFAEMLQHWGLSRPSVIAHDLGGATTLRAHLLHDCDFERYVLMNVVAMRPWGSDFFDHMGKHVDAFQGLPSHIHQALVEAYIHGALVNELPRSDLDGLIAPWLTEDGAVSFYRQFAQADEKYTAQVQPMFGEIRCPTRIVWGEDDPWIPIDRARSLHHLMPTAEFEAIRGAGHMPQLETPGLLLPKLLDFLPT